MKRFYAFAVAVAFATQALAADPTSQRTFYPPAVAVVKPQPMPLGDQLPIEIVLGQQEMGVDVSTTGAAVTGAIIGGLVGGLISAGIANAQVKAAEERVVPLRNALISYDFSKRVDTALRAKLASEGISMNPSIVSMATTWDALDAQNANRLPMHAMVIYPRYAVDSKFARLRVQLLVQIVDRKIKSNGKVKAKPSFSRVYAFNYDIRDGRLEDNIARWSSLGGESMGVLIDRGIEQTVDMLVHDFSTQGRKEWKRSTIQQNVYFKGERYPGFSVRQTDDYVWVRSGGKTQFFEGFQPLDIAAFKAAQAAASAAAPQTAAVAADAAPAATAPVEAQVEATVEAKAEAAVEAKAEATVDAAAGDTGKAESPAEAGTGAQTP
ncbi:MAG: hypothetical protein ACOY82_12630 [Pseudomonadota bacterium]